MRVEIRPATVDDAAQILASVREYDWQAVQGWRLEPLLMLRETIARATETYLGLIDDTPVSLVVVQVKNVCAGHADVGVLSMQAADDHPLVYARHTMRLCRELQSRYMCLTGETDEAYGLSRRWLSWLGFELNENTFIWRRT